MKVPFVGVVYSRKETEIYETLMYKQINLKNRTYYFWNDQIWVNNFDAKNLKLDKQSYEDIHIYYIGYVTKKPEYNIDSVNPLHSIIKEFEGYVEENNENKYLTIALTDNNNQVLADYAKVRKGILEQIKKINNGKIKEWGKEYMKIRFNLDDDIPLNKVLNFCALTIVIRSIFENDGKYYPQIYLDDALVDV